MNITIGINNSKIINVFTGFYEIENHIYFYKNIESANVLDKFLTTQNKQIYQDTREHINSISNNNDGTKNNIDLYILTLVFLL